MIVLLNVVIIVLLNSSDYFILLAFQKRTLHIWSSKLQPVFRKCSYLPSTPSLCVTSFIHWWTGQKCFHWKKIDTLHGLICACICSVCLIYIFAVSLLVLFVFSWITRWIDLVKVRQERDSSFLYHNVKILKGVYSAHWHTMNLRVADWSRNKTILILLDQKGASVVYGCFKVH